MRVSKHTYGNTNSGFPESVNYHFLKACNMHCRYCFAHFNDTAQALPLQAQLEIVRLLSQSAKKVTLAGGEPTLSKHLPRLLHTIKHQGALSCLATNGSRLSVAQVRELSIDWLTLSIDSRELETHQLLGRCVKGAPCSWDHYVRLADAAHRYGKHLKVNTVVCRANLHEDFGRFVSQLAPERWKIFQLLPIVGENDDAIEDLAITEAEFHSYIERQRTLLQNSITVMLPEENDLMRGSYAMVDHLGRFFDDITGRMRYGRPILEVGIKQAWKDVHFDRSRFVRRGGSDYFKREKSGEVRQLPRCTKFAASVLLRGAIHG